MIVPKSLLALVQVLAEDEARRDYLAAQAVQQQPEAGERTNPAPLPATERAA